MLGRILLFYWRRGRKCLDHLTTVILHLFDFLWAYIGIIQTPEQLVVSFQGFLLLAGSFVSHCESLMGFVEKVLWITADNGCREILDNILVEFVLGKDC